MRRGQARIAAFAAGIAACFGGLVAPLPAQEAPATTLTPGKGSDLTMARCAICHEITHVTRAKLSRGEWEDNVRNMIERGAPIAPNEIPVIVDYLATYYSRDSAPPPPDPAAASAAAAQDPVQRLLADNACTSCHGVDQKIVGPSFREVAVRYANDGAAGKRLADKIKLGGAGTWGAIPMPPHDKLNDAELAQIVSWILARK